MSGVVTTDFLDAFVGAWNRHDTNAILEMMTPDCVLCLASGASKEGFQFNGREAIRAAIGDLFARMPDVQWQNPRHFISGDRGVTEWAMLATTRDGQRIEANGCDIFHFKEGRVAIKNSYRKFPA